MKFNRIAKTAVATTGALAFAMTVISGTAMAQEKKAKKEKCYGVVAKGFNDCEANGHSCAGQAKTDADGQEWMYVSRGLCAKIAGSSATPKA